MKDKILFYVTSAANQYKKDGNPQMETYSNKWS